MVDAYLGLGSNLGDRETMLRSAVAALSESAGVTVTAISPVYETPPWGPVPQGPYLNACVAIATSLSPRALLDLCLAIERRHGRERSVRWGPRTLDIDILDYGGMQINEPGLALPHPRLAERAFVLVPLADIAPDLVIEGRTVAASRAAIDAGGVTARPDISLAGPV
ncbi:2-amino-4-hydroxy-6-hydroxymethyldihydropteridine diphosphokinase [Kaistia geumhonensis]|uniref:2-amino-4-hydroxy-6-hydroxymethyldihydropteridine pyrophosphokinase n=1 Tax=Kaistia geumhonensis TaxID=410839 RepID=A0ABU0M2C3_9HYPH|nr:2-amino-4-hydroxy-6-hydroxymethyldihydropteridine diphosphokinase [Kaistia geumhonensis]MCX5479669.1 2-amino-4-hydroxy-6-hydroxymethyldihydropteridine diphosphokinase [Kaistia geumhonensis]MDQ0515107.1 2-amino-4-hydroxy-6-hydroxymethyldihydropteridine diphosphokinase [Kaistia geumhonensis]